MQAERDDLSCFFLKQKENSIEVETKGRTKNFKEGNSKNFFCIINSKGFEKDSFCAFLKLSFYREKKPIANYTFFVFILAPVKKNITIRSVAGADELMVLSMMKEF